MSDPTDDMSYHEWFNFKMAAESTGIKTYTLGQNWKQGTKTYPNVSFDDFYNAEQKYNV